MTQHVAYYTVVSEPATGQSEGEFAAHGHLITLRVVPAGAARIAGASG